MYVDFICNEVGISRELFFSKSRKTRYSLPRYMFYYICIQRPMTINHILDFMVSCNFKVTRQNIENGIKKIEENEDKDLWILINACLEEFENE